MYRPAVPKLPLREYTHHRVFEAWGYEIHCAEILL